MRLLNIQEILKNRKIYYDYTEEDDLASIDFTWRGLSYHIWEFRDEEGEGAETNVFHTGSTRDVEGDYEAIICEELNRWPMME